jgi:hypothetical protein
MTKPRILRIADGYWECYSQRRASICVGTGETPYEAWCYCIWGNAWHK